MPLILGFLKKKKIKLLTALNALSRISHFRQDCRNSKFGIFELLVWKETPADVLLTGKVS